MVLTTDTASARIEKETVHLADSGTHSVLRILESCRQIHSEAKGIFYSSNVSTYRPASLTPLGCFLLAISNGRRQPIRSITLKVEDSFDAYQEINTFAVLVPSPEVSTLSPIAFSARHALEDLTMHTHNIKTAVSQMKKLRGFRISIPEYWQEATEEMKVKMRAMEAEIHKTSNDSSP